MARKSDEKFSQTNAFAMQSGLVMGIYAIVSILAWGFSIVNEGLSFLFILMTLASPFCVGLLTRRFRLQTTTPAEGFSFGRGFAHSLLTGFYAAIWAALFVFVYLTYFDHGLFFDVYEEKLMQPETLEIMKQTGMEAQINAMTDGQGMRGIANALRAVSPANYAVFVIYLNLLIAPILSLIIGFSCRQSPRRGTV